MRSVERDVALVLSGGGINGVLLEVGFLKRLRETALWPRIGWIYGTSAGALTGSMAALDRVDELERFVLDLQAEDTFRPNRLWRLPLLGLHDYALPETVERAFGDRVQLARELTEAPVELIVFATDVTDTSGEGDESHFELIYSSRKTPPEELAQALLASAAISALVLPVRVGDRIATDGAWVRNYPLSWAAEHPEVKTIVAFRYVPRYPRISVEALARLRRRLERARAMPPVRALVAELKEAEARAARGEPAHFGDMMARLFRVAIMRNTDVEERLARVKDASISELESLRRDMAAIVAEHARPTRRGRARRAVEQRFAAAQFPFRHERIVPRLVVRGDAGSASLEHAFRAGRPWSREEKQALIDRGYRLTDEVLRAQDPEEALRAS